MPNRGQRKNMSNFSPEERLELISCLVNQALEAGDVSGVPYSILESSFSRRDKSDFWDNLHKQAAENFDFKECVDQEGMRDMKCIHDKTQKISRRFASLLSKELSERMTGDDQANYQNLPGGRQMDIRSMGIKALRDVLADKVSSEIIDNEMTAEESKFPFERQRASRRVEKLNRILQEIDKCYGKKRRLEQLGFLAAMRFGNLGKRTGFESMEGPASQIYKFL